jgi:fimbrial isopeptide formation D2 family protein/LPXTG-motif cell wall-anchored protein
MSSTLRRRVGATLGVLTVAVLASFGMAAPASAEPGNIDPTIPRSLTVHKYELGPTSPQNGGTGQEIPGGIPNGVPIEGVTFTATLIPDVDLRTAGGWTTAGNLTPATAAPIATGQSWTAVTGADGVATFQSTAGQMPIGLYLVRETAAPASVTDRTAPFLVSLPFPTGGLGSPANEWIYNVHVYPKNSVTNLVKTRIAPAAGSVESRNPDLVRWAIRAGIPTIAAGGTISDFTVSDTIPTGLEFVTTPPAGVTGSSVIVRNASGAAQTFAAGTDYTLSTTGSTQTVTFTAAARTRLATAAFAAGTVELNVLTRAVSTPADGQLTNTASATVNGSTESVSAVTNIGEFTLFAYAPTGGGGRTPLAGATYQLFLSEADANAGTNPITVGGVSSWTTDDDGIARIPAITPGTYWGREITPPAGFQPPRLTTPAQVVAGTTSTTAPIRNYIEVPHTQLPPWALPLTGGDGALWFGVGGGALVLIAVGAAIVVARRRRAADPSAV